jgi:hypothetical protein
MEASWMVSMVCECLELTDRLGHPERGFVRDLEVRCVIEIDSDKSYRIWDEK